MSYNTQNFKNELKKVYKFKELLDQFNKIEQDEKDQYNRSNSSLLGIGPREFQYYIQTKCSKKSNNYLSLRESIAMEIPAIRRIANTLGINTERISCPPISVGGPTISVDIFNSALEDHGYVETNHTTRMDCLNKVIGILQETKKSSLLKLINPFYILNLGLRIPFILISQTGFNVEKIEDAFWGKFFKLIFMLLFLYFCLKNGFSHGQIVDILKFQ